MHGVVVLEGLICVQAAVEAGSRRIEAIYIADGVPTRRIRSLLHAAGRRGYPVTRLPRSKVDALAAGTCHGGILALAGRRRLVPLDALLRTPTSTGVPAFLAMLDGVEDPYQFGQALRALYAAGATGLLTGPRDWTDATTMIARASAGASERLPMAAARDLPELTTRLRQARIRILCAQHHRGQPIAELDLTAPMLLVIGGAHRGISRPWTQAADATVSVPYARPFAHSLDTTSATAALAFEIARQRRTRPT